MNEEISWKQKIVNFYHECVRVLSITKKPDRTEFMTIFKASGLGMLLIGLIGFLIHMVRALIFAS